MKNQTFLVALGLFLSLGIRAQNDVDALRYSMLQYGSSARAIGTGGAFGAIGGDFGAISINPAGLGVYSSSEIQFSPGFTFTGARSNYLGVQTDDSRANVNVGSAGFVYTGKNDNYRYGSGLRHVSTSFAFGVNRLAGFSSGREFSGYNQDNSLLDSYEDFLNSGSGTPTSEAFDADPFGAGLAYDAYLLNPIPGDSMRYYGVIPDGEVWQTKRLTSRGSVSEMLIALGANFGHKLYIGGSVGIPFLKYVEEYTYSESDRDDAIAGFSHFDQQTNLETKDQHWNVKSIWIRDSVRNHIRIWNCSLSKLRKKE